MTEVISSAMVLIIEATRSLRGAVGGVPPGVTGGELKEVEFNVIFLFLSHYYIT